MTGLVWPVSRRTRGEYKKYNMAGPIKPLSREKHEIIFFILIIYALKKITKKLWLAAS